VTPPTPSASPLSPAVLSPSAPAPASVTPFLTRRTVIVHNLPVDKAVWRRVNGRDVMEEEEEGKKADSKSDGASAVVPQQQQTSTAAALEHKQVPASTPTAGVRYHYHTSTVPPPTDLAAAQLPDLIITLSKKHKPSECVGYLRVPMDGRKRPTENWEKGQDLSVWQDLWVKTSGDKSEGGALEGAGGVHCVPLKPVREMYENSAGWMLMRYGTACVCVCVPCSDLCLLPLPTPSIAVTPLPSSTAHTHTTSAKQPLPAVRRRPYKLLSYVYQAHALASVEASGLSTPFVRVQLMDSVVTSSAKPRTTHPNWFEVMESRVVLPVSVEWAPQIVLTVHHQKKNGCGM
jgi:hypothetical protein